MSFFCHLTPCQENVACGVYIDICIYKCIYIFVESNNDPLVLVRCWVVGRVNRQVGSSWIYVLSWQCFKMIISHYGTALPSNRNSTLLLVLFVICCFFDEKGPWKMFNAEQLFLVVWMD